jgi:hypothetical protein
LLLNSENSAAGMRRRRPGMPTVWYRWSPSLLLPLSQIISHFGFVLNQIYLILTKFFFKKYINTLYNF